MGIVYFTAVSAGVALFRPRKAVAIYSRITFCSYSYFGESVFDQVADRYQADEVLMADDREMAKPSIGHFFHGHMNALILTHRDHHGGHTL